MKTVIFFLTVLFFFAFPVAGGASILSNDKVLWPKSSGIARKETRMKLCENGNTQDDPATDDGEDLRDGDSDSNSNLDSDN